MRDGIAVRAALGTLGVCAMIATTGTALADEAPDDRGAFGAPGTVVLGGDFRVGYSKSSTGDTKTIFTDVGVGANVDVFAAPRFSIGLAGVFEHARTSTTGGQDLGGSRLWLAGAALRLGYYVPLGAHVGFWPMVSAGTTHIRADANDAQVLDGRVDQIKLLANILFHVDRGWFLSVTPGVVAYSSSTSGIGVLGGSVPSVALGFGGYL